MGLPNEDRDTYIGPWAHRADYVDTSVRGHIWHNSRRAQRYVGTLDRPQRGWEREGGRGERERESALFPHPCTSPSPNPIPHSLVPSAVGPMCHPLPHSFIPAHFIQLLFPTHKPRFLDSAFKVATFNRFYVCNMHVVQQVQRPLCSGLPLVLFSPCLKKYERISHQQCGQTSPKHDFCRLKFLHLEN